MIASISWETYNDDRMIDHIGGRTHIWVVSDKANVEGAIQKDHLKMNSTLRKMYANAKSHDTFTKEIVPLYFDQLIGDLDAIQDIRELAYAARGKAVKIALMGHEWDELICVRSVLIGLLQGAGIVKDYMTDCFPTPMDYSRFFQMAPPILQNTIRDFKPAKRSFDSIVKGD